MKNPLAKQSQQKPGSHQSSIPGSNKIEHDFEELRPIARSRTKASNYKIIIANIVNVILVAVVIFLLNKYEPTAKKIKELRSENIAAQESSDIAILQSDLERNSEQINELKEIFLDDEGFITFISQIDALKLEGTISEFIFPGGKPVKDKSGNIGFPLSIQFKGTRQAVDDAVRKVQSLPYIIKPVNIDLAVQSEEDVLLIYSAFLLVDESFFTN